MITKLKIAAYVILAALAIWFGRQFYSNYSQIGQTTVGPATNTAPKPAPSPKPGQTNPAIPVPPPATATNQSTTNLAATNVAAGSNLVQQPITLLATNVATNVTTGETTGETTNATTNLTTNVASAVAASNSTVEAAPTAATGVIAPNAAQGGRSVKYLAELVGALIGLGLLLAYDLSHFLGSRAVDYLFNDEGEGMRDPEYERAEQTWVNGKPLEAIEMMREYLKKNPRSQFVALRIAEIYEKDLHNYVAASLEYEEVLKKRLPAERWGWAAIHLCNIYSRLGQQDKMRALLERVARDYPKTGAAKKARRNLGLPEPAEEAVEPAPEPEAPVEGDTYSTGKVFDLDEAIAAADEEVPAPPPEAEPPPPEPPKSNLPPGFRKKK
jgi:TolA-binding protein